MSTHEREIATPVTLARPDGRLDRNAVGWSRRPMHDTALPGRWGRRKRWEYWCFTTNTHLVAVTVSSLDYVALTGVYFLEYGGAELEKVSVAPLSRGVALPDSLDGGRIDVTAGKVRVSIIPAARGTRVLASCLTAHGYLEADLFSARPAGHESMNVVIPWDDHHYQYTSKQVARPAEGVVSVGCRTFGFDDGWSVLDHGRGRWPYDTLWNWGAASGRAGDRTVGIQLGGKWTEGTGLTENALVVDGRVTKIGSELNWTYDTRDLTKPWRIAAPDAVDLTFMPFHERHVRANALVLSNDTRQVFGHYSGLIYPDGEPPLAVDSLLGWAEQVHMRW
ncbi:DUF2804 domain-containing protein [Antrihabitans sp. YC2-6]|uniref:DUF2804 domain-containing protein n=1 Tax=Antrihabitans sp. YC2-6 TaxID=2799498 RepID=UPI0018F288D0|nr:DUF2804 domain-containing protein [Antrihabitans sp. YC2-6]MBJ8344346.1 DUF2804 domain-containing protein [Antrihabitans sp. YC2-6]